VFRGITSLTIDSKGRLAVPARFREVLQFRAAGKLVVTADSASCLLLYPAPDWDPIQQKLMSLSSFNQRTRDLQRLLVGNASDVEIDSAGRILVPGPLQVRGLEGCGAGGTGARFELWDEAKWEAQMEKSIAPGETIFRRSWRASRSERRVRAATTAPAFGCLILRGHAVTSCSNER
jgi:MraZ protein